MRDDPEKAGAPSRRITHDPKPEARPRGELTRMAQKALRELPDPNAHSGIIHFHSIMASLEQARRAPLAPTPEDALAPRRDSAPTPEDDPSIPVDAADPLDPVESLSPRRARETSSLAARRTPPLVIAMALCAGAIGGAVVSLGLPGTLSSPSPAPSSEAPEAPSTSNRPAPDTDVARLFAADRDSPPPAAAPPPAAPAPRPPASATRADSPSPPRRNVPVTVAGKADVSPVAAPAVTLRPVTLRKSPSPRAAATATPALEPSAAPATPPAPPPDPCNGDLMCAMKRAVGQK